MSIFSANAQNDRIFTQQSLSSMGFENVCVAVSSDTVYAKVEDTAYRGNFRGPSEALKCLRKEYSSCSVFELVVTEYEIPKVCVHASVCDDKWNVCVDYDVESTLKKLKNEKKEKSSFGKIDINLIPIFTLDNHRYDKLFEVGVFFAPSFETTLWKGNRVIIQPIIPIYTNLEIIDSHRNVRLGVAAISQDLYSGKRWTAKVAAGAFYQDVVGAYAEVGYHLNSRLDLGAHIGYSYTSVFYDKKWYLGNPSMLNMMVTGSYYEPKTSIQIQAQAGCFMYGDWGGRVDFTKHFGEYAIGVYGILTGGEHNGGFHFAIPFGGKRQFRKGFVRLKAPEYYDMQYSMVSYWKYAKEKMGREFEEIPDKNHSAHYWQSQYIQKYMQKYLNDSFE